MPHSLQLARKNARTNIKKFGLSAGYECAMQAHNQLDKSYAHVHCDIEKQCKPHELQVYFTCASTCNPIQMKLSMCVDVNVCVRIAALFRPYCFTMLRKNENMRTLRHRRHRTNWQSMWNSVWKILNHLRYWS